MFPRLIYFCFALAIAGAQSAPAPAFEAASIKLNKGTERNRSLSFNPGRFTATNMDLSLLILVAYGIKDYQLSGGPSWINSDGYDITGTAANAATDPQLRLMLQTLLADRFKLALHREERELPVYFLIPGKNAPKLQQSTSEGASYLSPIAGGVGFKRTSMQAFGDFLSRLGPISRPVLDKTGLAGIFDFNLTLSDSQIDLTRPDETKRAIVTWPTIFTDVQEQLGLKLDSQKAPVETFVIEHVEKPSDN